MVLLILLLLSSSASAAEIHYSLRNGNVVGYTRTAADVQAGNAVLSVPSDFTWPPPRGCPTGKEQWSRVQNGDAVIVKAELLFWYCHQVNTAAEVNAALAQELVKVSGDKDDVTLLSESNKALAVLVVECPTDGLSLDCDQKRSDAQTQIVDLQALTVSRQQLKDDAAQFIVDHNL